MTDVVWKRWLKDRHELHRQTQYVSIPFVGQGYQKLHLEGMKALLSFLPLSNWGTSIRPGTLRDAFLCHTAVLLAVPECYRQQLVALGVIVSTEWRTTMYVEANFAVASRISANIIVQFLASASVQPEEAEQWRPWVTAFIEMELEDHPTTTHAPLFQSACEQAMALIKGDPKWVLMGLHSDSPRNWDPHLKQQCKERATKLQAAQSEAGLPLAPADTSAHPGQSLPPHTDGTDPLANALNYNPSDDGYGEEPNTNEHDDDTLMGPG